MSEIVLFSRIAKTQAISVLTQLLRWLAIEMQLFQVSWLGTVNVPNHTTSFFKRIRNSMNKQTANTSYCEKKYLEKNLKDLRHLEWVKLRQRHVATKIYTTYFFLSIVPTYPKVISVHADVNSDLPFWCWWPSILSSHLLRYQGISVVCSHDCLTRYNLKLTFAVASDIWKSFVTQFQAFTVDQLNSVYSIAGCFSL